MNNEKTKEAWRLLGYCGDDLQAMVQNVETCLARWWDGPPANPDDVRGWTSDVHLYGMAVFAMGSMGYSLLPAPLDDWREVGRRVVAASLYYFFGPWRNSFQCFGERYDRVKGRAELDWSSSYREGLAVASALSDWRSVDLLMSWPGPDLPFDEGMDDRTHEDNAYQIWLASCVRGDRPGALLQRSRIELGTRKRPKMLLAAAEEILASDKDGFGRALEGYLHYYLKHELRTNRPDFAVCADATVLWHLARRRKIGGVLPPEVAILIPTP